MSTEELKSESLRVKNAIAEFITAQGATKRVIEKLRTYKQENPKPSLVFEVTDLNGPAGRARNEVLVMAGGNFVEEYEAMVQLMNEFTQLCDEISLIPVDIEPIS
ncbi:hypothetical protein [Proteiniphilum sp. UBA5384]|jgi:hypothetical protein|uniref:hypothetical protein n=1 Tax=Proteiniphilum sp. UBA5384 TaxID=1947279 RepID=UPI0025F1F238|nr:hypothetical protein [Proteiniphilum sp. UBA5384]